MRKKDNQGQTGSTGESSGRRWLPLRETIDMPPVTSGFWGRAVREGEQTNYMLFVQKSERQAQRSNFKRKIYLLTRGREIQTSPSC